jgi:hypothetical protein
MTEISERRPPVRKIMLFLLVMLMVAGTVTAVESPGPALKDVPLVWKPTDTISSLDAIDLTAFQNVTILIKSFTDIRKHPSEIGKNVEKRKSENGLIVTTKDNVAAWLADRFAQVLREFEIDVARNAGTVTLEADVVKFFVTEESVYKADVAVKARLRSKTGDVLWEGMVTASSSRWGASFRVENYYEGLSNATIAAVHSLLKNDQFRQAVVKSRQ